MVIEVAFMVAASSFSSSGGIARSLPAITAHEGLLFHAAVVTVAPKTDAAVWPCVATEYLLLAFREILRHVFGNSFSESPLENLERQGGARCPAEPADTVC